MMMNVDKFLIRYVFRPDVAFIVNFFFVAFLGFGGKHVLIVYCLLFPWLALVILFFYLPMLAFFFRRARLEKPVKVNHVLEHGTIYFLREIYGRKARIGGRALRHGFRIYGDIESKKDIEEAFERLRAYLAGHKTAAVLSKRCGSNLFVSQTFSFVLLTLTTSCLLLFSLTPHRVFELLVLNAVVYLSLRTRLGKYLQKEWLMCFDFTSPVLVSVKSATRKRPFEGGPAYMVRTRYDVSE